jgi:hypothetical protein
LFAYYNGVNDNEQFGHFLILKSTYLFFVIPLIGRDWNDVLRVVGRVAIFDFYISKGRKTGFFDTNELPRIIIILLK